MSLNIRVFNTFRIRVIAQLLLFPYFSVKPVKTQSYLKQTKNFFNGPGVKNTILSQLTG